MKASSMKTLGPLFPLSLSLTQSLQMEFENSALDELCAIEEGSSSSKGKLGRRQHNNDKTVVFKSKNLEAERRRRQKLSDRLLALRALVPMNKATIIEDAINYIMELQNNVKNLSDLLLEMEASSEEGTEQMSDEIDAAKEMKKCGIEADVNVTNIDGEKLWIKIVFEKKRGGFTKLMEAMSFLGYEFTDTSVTTFKGAILISSCVEGFYGEKVAVARTRELLLEIIRSI
nr:basic helix-loop-helix transcription factor [Loropetalum chinense var. rubrum]